MKIILVILSIAAFALILASLALLVQFLPYIIVAALIYLVVIYYDKRKKSSHSTNPRPRRRSKRQRVHKAVFVFVKAGKRNRRRQSFRGKKS